MDAEHAPEGRLVAPNLWATLSVHVIASPGSHGAPEAGPLSVHSFSPLSLCSMSAESALVAGRDARIGRAAAARQRGSALLQRSPAMSPLCLVQRSGNMRAVRFVEMGESVSQRTRALR